MEGRRNLEGKKGNRKMFVVCYMVVKKLLGNVLLYF